MTFIDISLPIGPDLLTWPGNPEVTVTPFQRIADGDASNVSELRIGTHSGTHVDPPVHFVEGGAGIDRVALDVLVGECVVVDARGRQGELTAEDMEALAIPADAERVLLRTDNSDLWRRLPVEFPQGYVCVGPDAARWVVAHGIRLIGIDFLGIERQGSSGHPTHHELLSHGVVIVEGLDLGMADPGPYRLTVLPLRIVDGDGGPARAVLETR